MRRDCTLEKHSFRGLCSKKALHPLRGCMARDLRQVVILNPFTAPARKISGWKYTPPNSQLDGPITSLLSTLCILIEILSPAHAIGAKKLRWFHIWYFLSGGAASMAVKGLRQMASTWRGHQMTWQCVLMAASRVKACCCSLNLLELSVILWISGI